MPDIDIKAYYQTRIQSDLLLVLVRLIISLCTEYLQKYLLLLLQANQYFKNDNYVKAIKTYNEAINKFDSSAVLYGNRAAAYMKRAW